MTTISPTRNYSTNGVLPEAEQELDTISLADLVDIQDLQQIQDAFANITGVASLITNIDGTPITRPGNFSDVCQLVRTSDEGTRRCIESDRVLGEHARDQMRPAFSKCLSCGFVDASAPIIVGGQHIANWLIGQVNVFDADANMGVNRDGIAAYADEIGVNRIEMLHAYENASSMSLERFEQILNFLWILAEKISSQGYHKLQLARDMAARKRAEEERAALQQQVIEAQQATLRELSTPLIPISNDVVIMPLIGTIDSQRAQMILEALLQGVAQHRATLAILDITGVDVVDTQVAQALVQAAQSVKLLGAQVMLTGIQPRIAQTLVTLEVDLQGILTRGTLQAGIAEALRKT